MRCDLHVHTIHSGKCTVPGLSRYCLESCNEPLALYETLKRRGMDLVTVTDHDSIDAGEELRKYPDFFLSEEVTVTLPSGTEMHAGAYGITERDHIELQRRRTDAESLLAYALENRLFLTVNHAFSGLTGRRTAADFEIFREFGGVEAVNGHIVGAGNRRAADFAVRHRKPVTGGSDSHTLNGAGRTFTVVQGARNAYEYVAALRRGHGVPYGASGSCWKVMRTISGIGWSTVLTNRRTAVLIPLFAFVPVFAAVNFLHEHAFAWYWGRKSRSLEPESKLLSLRAA
ncbi:MAG TPA: PHP-associated domain-containing protein [Bryobacteraceae bacterium]|nr:PHP-associated domain-containing protein [Bryobacteraceae bacterium]